MLKLQVFQYIQHLCSLFPSDKLKQLRLSQTILVGGDNVYNKGRELKT